MFNWTSSDLKLDVDAVLRGQGADPAKLRERRPRLVDVAGQALQEARLLLQPRVISRQLEVRALRHQQLELEAGFSFAGDWVLEYLAPASTVIAVICTVGAGIEELASQTMEKDMVLALALDGVGSAGVEALSQAVCKQIEDQAARDGLKTSIPLSPGMTDWPVDIGQPVLFDILSPARIGVELNSACMMRPRKSLSMLIGVGKGMGEKGDPCDTCAMRGTCKYRDNAVHG